MLCIKKGIHVRKHRPFVKKKKWMAKTKKITKSEKVSIVDNIIDYVVFFVAARYVESMLMHNFDRMWHLSADNVCISKWIKIACILIEFVKALQSDAKKHTHVIVYAQGRYDYYCTLANRLSHDINWLLATLNAMLSHVCIVFFLLICNNILNVVFFSSPGL